MTRNDLRAALPLSPALVLAIWMAFEWRHGINIIQSIGGL